MEQYEKVERVAKQTGASFEEAKHALESCNWDMLDATILLEKQGRNGNTGNRQQVFSTDYEAQPGYRNVAATANINNSSDKSNAKSGDFSNKIKEFFKKSHVNHLVIRHDNKEIVSLPIWAAVLIALCLFKLTIVLLVIALICGCKLTFEGPDRRKMESVNKAVDTAGQAMSGAATAIKNSFEESYNKTMAQSAKPEAAQPEGRQNDEATVTAQPAAEPEAAAAEQPAQSPSEFEKEDFSAIVEGLQGNSVTTEDGKITLEL